MKWVETIRLLAPVSREQWRRQIEPAIRNILKATCAAPGPVEAKLYLNANQGGDVSLVLFWEEERLQPQGSREGLSLASSLKNFGLVNHSVWTEIGQRATRKPPAGPGF